MALYFYILQSYIVHPKNISLVPSGRFFNFFFNVIILDDFGEFDQGLYIVTTVMYMRFVYDINRGTYFYEKPKQSGISMTKTVNQSTVISHKINTILTSTATTMYLLYFELIFAIFW